MKSTFPLKPDKVIIYSEPLTMIVITVTNILNQKRVIDVVKRLRAVEERLWAEGGKISYTNLSRKTLFLVFVLIGGEATMMIYYFSTTIYTADATRFTALSTWFWLFLPITITSLARVWFIVLMDITELFFSAINQILDTTADTLETQSGFPAKKFPMEPIFDEFLGQKLMRLCHLHAEVGKISLDINRIFHLENLLAMLFTILLTVTQMYFIYLSALSQQVPPLFRAADSFIISVYYTLFGLWKVFYVIFVASEVKRRAQLTGSSLHQIAIAVDEVPCYRLTNQLSLQIWQQRLEFPVGGFFLLDMTTIGSCSGAILVYVIILIQFNLAGGS
ncbi:putative gustatory receptor 2a [Phlebotomus argentipes]|uniref:putative gustatory receptor 2a n=1 Tax=Phlebotomus argentipes TaxID=94469 RepID=UPI002892F8AC|nr:putative gustatory receptor 2a [Phlebotomus argentipes]